MIGLPADGRYGSWGGRPKGYPRDPNRCEWEVFPNERGGLHHQCERRWTVKTQDGHEWCRQHAAQWVRRDGAE